MPTASHRVRRATYDALAGSSVAVVACSGGADSLALAWAAIQVRGQLRHRGHALTLVGVCVDHGLQEGSAAQAAGVGDQLRNLGMDHVEVVAVSVVGTAAGREADARAARYAALDEVADRFGADTILLGHTLDDQAESVLLGLARGSGARSLQGMAVRRGRLARPLLGVRRSDTEATCAAHNLTPWQDPHNTDHSFARVRVRHEVLPVVESALGPGVAEALARTAAQLRADGAALDAVAEARFAAYDAETGWPVADLAAVPEALSSRLLRLSALRAGAPASDLNASHLAALTQQIGNTTQLPKVVMLPGGVVARRTGRHLRFENAPGHGSAP